VVDAMGVQALVLPMADESVATWVGARGRMLPFQEFMIVERGEGPIEAVELRGVAEARPTDVVLQAIIRAEAIVIGPSNPVISIGPILELPGMRAALREAAAPVVAVSPFVGGRSLKGITDECCRWAGIERSAKGIAESYGDVLDGIVADEEVAGLPCLVTDTLMESAEDRVALATKTLDFAAKLAA
jgi:LPPG:FO 2-phospho-L-lactate transferase